MRLAILSDIHGNDFAFRAAVEDARNLGAECYMIAGDLVTDFPMTSQVLARARTLTPWVIRGNREGYLLRFQNEPEATWRPYRQNAAIAWIYDQLQPEEQCYLAALPTSLSLKIEGKTFYMTHDLSLKPEKMPEIWVSGHTHRPELRKEGNCLFVNPGSIGVNRRKGFEAEYALLELEGNRLEAELCHVSYDVHGLMRTLKQSGMLEDPDAALWLQLVIRSTEEGVWHFVTYLKLMKEAEARHPGQSPQERNAVWRELVAELKSRGILSTGFWQEMANR